MRPDVWSHRGRLSPAPDEPENTLEAFGRSGLAGVDGIELDTWLTADGAFVVHHDRDVAAGRIDALTLAEVPPGVPALSAALDACAVATVNVELKVAPDITQAGAADLGSTLARYLLAEESDLVRAGRLVVSSFSLAALDAVRSTADATAGSDETAGRLPTGYLVAELPGADALAEVAGTGHRAVNVAHRELDDEGVTRCRAAGLAVVAWTADEPDDIRRLYDLGVDVVISNDPVVAMGLRGA